MLEEREARVNNIKSKVAEGKRPLYRTSQYKNFERAVEKQVKGRTWYGNKETVLFVQSTPGEQLRRSIQAEADRSKISIKVVERAGKTLRSLLQKSETEKVNCQDNDCVICETEDKGLCSKVVCNTCAIEKKDSSIKEKRVLMHGEISLSHTLRLGSQFSDEAVTKIWTLTGTC